MMAAVHVIGGLALLVFCLPLVATGPILRVIFSGMYIENNPEVAERLAAVPPEVPVAALLAIGVPLPAVMAFWLASPLMDPSMFVLTAGVLGTEFAIGKTVAEDGSPGR